MKVLLKNSNDNLLKDEDKLLATSKPDTTEYVTKTEFEELVKVTPTDIKRNDNNEIFLTHDGTEISGQNNKVKLPNGFDLFEAEGFITLGASDHLSADNLANYNKLKYPYAIRVAKGDLSGSTLIGYARALKQNNISYYIVHDEQNYFQLELNVSTGSYTWRMYEFNKLDLASYGTLYIKNSSGNFMPYLSMRGITLSNGAMPEHVTIKKTATNYDIINYTYSSVNVNQTIGDKTGLTCHVYCSDGYQDLWIYFSDNVWNYVFKDSNKQYVDERFDYVALSKTRFILNNALDEDDRQLLLDFYDKHYGKTKIPLFVVDAKGDIASVRMDNIKYFYFSVLTYAEKPIIMSVQPTLPNRRMGSTSTYLHPILGQDAWRNDVKARIGVNSDNQLIITDGAGNQTPGQSPSVLIPPFSYDNEKYSLDGIVFPRKSGTVALAEDFKTINNKSLLITDSSDTNINVGTDFGAKQWNFTQMDSFKFHFADEDGTSGADIDIVFPMYTPYSGSNILHLAIEENTPQRGTGKIQYLSKGKDYDEVTGDIIGFSKSFTEDSSLIDNKYYDGLYIGYDNGYYLKSKGVEEYPQKIIRENNETNQFEFISQSSSTSKTTVKLNVDNDGTLLTSNDISLATINEITSLTESYDGVNRLTVDNKNDYASIKVNDNSVEYPYTLQDGDKIEIEISTLNGINFTINGKSYSSIGTKEINLNDSNIDISIPSETIDSSPATYVTTIIYHKILGDKIISLGNLATFLATQLSQYSKKQYFDHQITVSDNSNSSFLFHVTSSNNLKCDSPQDLTTLLKPDPNVTRYAVTCISDTIGEAILNATSVGSNIIWKVTVGGGDILITTVADVVTLI